MTSIRRNKLQGLPSYFTSWGLKSFDNDAAFVTAKGSVATEGDTYYNSTDDEIRVFDGTNWRTVITADASGNVIIDGNLTVDGTSTTLNTATLEVEDANIIVNHNGNQTSADNVAGITVEMSDAQDAALIYDKDVASRFLIGDTNTLKEVTTVSDTQTLTNKTIDANNNTISNLAHGAEVDNPTSGVHGVTGNVVGTTDTQTLTGKTIDGDLNTISNLAHGAEVDNPTSGVHGVTGNVVGTTDAQTLTNKTIDAALNTISNIDNADIATGAAIARNKLANGTADHVIINDASGVMSSEAALAKVRGGTGADNTSVTFPATGTIVTEAGTQTLSNKSISDALTYSHITTPANPGAGALKLYAKNDKFYKLNSAGEEVEVGSGAGGAGGINFFDNPDFETNISDWTSSDAGVALSAETVAPLVGTRSLLVTKDAANRENEFVSGTARDIDLSYRGRPLPLSFEFDTTDANYASDDIRVAVYDNTNAAYLYVAPVSNVSDTLGLLKTSGKALVMVYPESTTVSITPRLIVNSTNATSYALKFDDFKIGPDMVVPGAIIGNTTPFTPDWTNLTVGNAEQDFTHTRIGDLVLIKGTIKLGSTSSVGSAPYFTIPGIPELTTLSANTITDGITNLYDASTSSNRQLGRIYVFNNRLYPAAATGNLSAIVPFTWATDDRLEVQALFKVTNWEASASLSTTEAAWQNVYAFASSDAGTQSISNATDTVVNFEDVNSDKFNVITTGSGWKATALTAAVHELNFNLILTNATGWDLGETSFAYIKHYNSSNVLQDSRLVSYYELPTSDSTGVGLYINHKGTASFDMSSGDYLQVEVRQNSGGAIALANFGNNVEFKAKPNFHTFSVFGKSEVIEAEVSLASYGITAGSYGTLASILVPKGEWDVETDGVFRSNGATTTTLIYLLASEFNDGTGSVPGINTALTNKATTSGTWDMINAPKRTFIVNEPTTIYMVGRANTSITNLEFAGRIRARRIK